jgi:uncharacterized membrane protein YeaQ/YmgE (transglycosylase-associated protein family)
MISLIILLVYGIMIGLIAKAIHPGEDPVGLGSTVLVGIGGTFVGKILGLALVPVLGKGLLTSGVVLAVVGGVVCLAIWRWWKLKKAADGPKNFWSGK